MKFTVDIDLTKAALLWFTATGCGKYDVDVERTLEWTIESGAYKAREALTEDEIAEAITKFKERQGL